MATTREQIDEVVSSYRLGTMWFTIWLVFASLCFLLIFQFVLHLSQTKDLQRRIGTLEQQVQTLTRTTPRDGGQ